MASDEGKKAAMSRRGFIGTGAAVAAVAAVPGLASAASVTPALTPLVGGWRFGPFVAGSDQATFDDSALQVVTLPHTVVPLSWHDWDPTTWEKDWIYRKGFDLLPQGGQRVFVDIDGAMTGAIVVVNGTQAGSHLGGYTPFSVEVTQLLVASGQQLMAIHLDGRSALDVPPNDPAYPRETGGDPTWKAVGFLQPAGIHRSVTLRTVPATFIADAFAQPTTVQAGNSAIDVHCTFDVGTTLGNAAVKVIVRNAAGAVLKSAQRSVWLKSPGTATAAVSLDGLNVQLWDLDTPTLYTVTTQLLVAGVVTHSLDRRIGFRNAVFTAGGFFLNSRNVKLRGVCRHHLFPYVGPAMGARVQAKDADVIKNRLGCNMVRSVHYPHHPAFLDACDEIGLLVWEEIPGFQTLHIEDPTIQGLIKRDVTDMIMRDRHHPCIMVWGVRANETPDNTSLWTATQSIARSLDPTRQTTGAMIGPNYATTNFQQDVFSQNDYSGGLGHPTLRPPRNDFKPYFVSESIDGLNGPATQIPRTASLAVQQGQATSIATVYDIAYGNAGYCGLSVWEGMDHQNAKSGAADYVKYSGVLDMFREPKLSGAFYIGQIDPAKSDVIEPAFYWDFGAKLPNGPGAEAYIFSNCDMLKVYIDGAFFQQLAPTTKWPNLPHPPFVADFSGISGSGSPELRIDGFRNGTKVMTRSFSSHTASDRLAVWADDASIVADGVDATRVVFCVQDKFGARRPWATGNVSVHLSGPARLLGDSTFDLGAAGGVGAVWIRSQVGQTGTATITVSHAALGTHGRQVRIASA